MSTQQKNLLKLSVIILGLWIASILNKETLSTIMTTGFIALGALYAISNASRISSFINNWPKSLSYSALTLYACKIISEKSINARYGIDVENISHASSISGVILSIPISLLLIGIYLYISTATKKLSLKKQNLGSHTKEKFPKLRACFAGCTLLIVIPISKTTETLIPYTLLADAVKISACGPIEDDIMYLKKNSKSCYRIHTNLIKGIYEITSIDTPP